MRALRLSNNCGRASSYLERLFKTGAENADVLVETGSLHALAIFVPHECRIGDEVGAFRPLAESTGDLETVVATLTPPRLQVEEEPEIEEETEVVGEGEEPEAEAAAEAEGGGEQQAEGGE